MYENISKLSSNLAITIAGEITKSGFNLEAFGEGDHWIIELFKSIEKVYDSMGDAGPDTFRMFGNGFVGISTLLMFGFLAASEYFHNDTDK